MRRQVALQLASAAAIRILGGGVLGGWLFAAALPLAAAQSEARSSDSGFTVAWRTNANADVGAPGRIFVEVTGIPAPDLRRLDTAGPPPIPWPELLAVHAESGDLIASATLPPMLGTCRVMGETLRFEPQFPLEAGPTYRAVFRPRRLPSGSPTAPLLLSASWRRERTHLDPTTVVSRIFPSTDVLPENVLKFYLQFNAPMSRGQVYEHVQLVDTATRRVIQLPFLELGEELWNPEMTRLTLFIDPGRIKRGLRPLEEVGPALEAGHRYDLVVDRRWLDATGTPLRADHRKTFSVGPPDRVTPDPAKWRMTIPASRTRGPLTIRFDEPLDHALAQRCIRVQSEAGHALAGTISLDDGEQGWSFQPDQEWRAGTYHLQIQTRIEDLAGNNVGKAYDVQLADGTLNHRNPELAERAFVVP